MTDNEIRKALECVIGNDVNCSECTYQKVLPFPSCRMMCAKNALDLIKRQKGEIERLKKEVEDKERAYNDEFCLRKEWQTKCQELLEEKQITTSEAIKKFAHFVIGRSRNGVIQISDVPDLVKEMTEENEK